VLISYTKHSHLFDLFFLSTLLVSEAYKTQHSNLFLCRAMYHMNVTSPFAFRYYYKFIVNGQWKHSTSSPAERDDSGNVNNIIMIGETASVRPSVQHQQKVCSL
jgi:hypothetical protein